MANGVSSGDIITKSKRSDLVSDPSVIAVTTQPADEENKVEVQGINFREQSQAPNRTEQEEKSRQREISTGDPRKKPVYDVQPGAGPVTETSIQSQIQTVEQQLGKIQGLERGQQVKIAGKTLNKQEAEQALQTRREELEQLETAEQEPNIGADIQETPISEGGIQVDTVANVQDAETISPKQEFRPRLTEEPRSVQPSATEKQSEVINAFKEQEGIVDPSRLQAARIGQDIREQREQLETSRQAQGKVEEAFATLEQAERTGQETVLVQGQEVPVSTVREQVEQTETELKEQKETTVNRLQLGTGKALETIDLTAAPTRTEEIQLQVKNLREESNAQVAGEFLSELGEFTVTSAAELGAEATTTGVSVAATGSTYLGNQLDKIRPEPDLKEQFRELTPSLLVAQERGGQIGRSVEQKIDREQFVEGAGTIATGVTGTFLPGFQAIGNIPQVEQAAGKAVSFAFNPEGLGQEVPEFATELGGSFAVGEQAIEQPRKTGAAAAAGGTLIAKKFAENPLGFTRKEILPDIALDVATGSLAPMFLPEASEIVQTRGQVRGAFTNTRRGQLGTTKTIKESNVVEPELVSDFGPETLTTEPTAPPTLEPVEPVTTEPTTTTQTQAVEQPATEGLVGPEPVVEPEEVSGARPRTEIEAAVKPVVEPFARPQTQSVPLVQSRTEPVAKVEPLTQARPQVQPQPQTRPQILPMTRVDIDQDVDAVNNQFGGEEQAGRGTEVTPSIGSVFSGWEQQEDEIQEEFTGLEQRPIPVETESTDSEDNTDDVEQELTSLF